MKEEYSEIYFDRKKNKFNGLSKKVLKELKANHPNIDIDHELKKMVSWLNSVRGAAHKGTFRFIKLWLSKASSCQATQYLDINSIGQFSSIQEHFDNYLEGLWKDRHHILEANTKTG